MKKYFLILIIVVMLVFPFSKVFAAEVSCNTLQIGEENVCVSHSDKNIDNCEITTDIDSVSNVEVDGNYQKYVPPTEKFHEKECSELVPVNKNEINLYVIVDDSGSMDNDPKRGTTLNGSIKNLVEKFKGYGAGNGHMVVRFFQKDRDEKYYNGKIKNYNKTIDVTKLSGATNFFKALENVKDDVASLGSNKIPVVVFMTDGYPTIGHGINLHHLSSAKLFYDASIMLSRLSKEITSRNGIFVTVGLGLNADDPMARYFLNPNAKNFESLCGDKNYESLKYCSLLGGNKDSKKHVVAGVGGASERGILGAKSYSVKSKEFIIAETRYLKANELRHLDNDDNRGLYVGPVKNQNGSKPTKGQFDLHYGENGKIDAYDVWEIDKTGWYFIVFNSNSMRNYNEWRITSTKKLEYQNYVGYGPVNLNGVVDKFYKNITSTMSLNDWGDDVLPAKGKDKIEKKYDCSWIEPIPATCKNVPYKYNKKSYKSYCKDYFLNIDGISVPYFVIERDISFQPGTLSTQGRSKDDDENIIFNNGEGFRFSGISYSRRYEIIFKYKSTNNRIIGTKLKSGKNIYVEVDKTEEELKSLINISNPNPNPLTFKAIDSNEKNNFDNDKKIDISSIIDFGDNNNIKVKSASLGLDKKFTYDCDNTTENECFEDGRYYIPYNYNKEIFDVNIYFKTISGANLSTVCKIPVGENILDKLLSYRSIDLSNPFPKSNNNLNKIPINWRDFYCNNGSCSNNLNVQRLINSYNHMDYSIELKNNDLSKYILNNSSYDEFEGYIDLNGDSKYVKNNNFNSIASSSVNYCKWGEISSGYNTGCDSVVN